MTYGVQYPTFRPTICATVWWQDSYYGTVRTPYIYTIYLPWHCCQTSFRLRIFPESWTIHWVESNVSKEVEQAHSNMGQIHQFPMKLYKLYSILWFFLYHQSFNFKCYLILYVWWFCFVPNLWNRYLLLLSPFVADLKIAVSQSSWEECSKPFNEVVIFGIPLYHSF